MGVIPDTQRSRIQAWAKTAAHPVSLGYAVTGHPQDASFKAFATELADLAGCLKIKKDADTQADRPSLLIGGHVTYQAIPLDRELERFLAALSDPAAFVSRLSPETQGRLDLLQLPAMVKIYITPGCPFCPDVVAMLLGMAGYSDQIRLTVIDGTLFPEAAEKDRVQSAPTVILDDMFRWTGSASQTEMVNLMLSRNPADLGADALRAMIEAGDADGVARLMVRQNQIFPAFMALLAHPRWSVRLGAMVAFETLAETAPELAKHIVLPIVEIFQDADPAVKGDLLHILGESKNPEALSFLLQAARTETDAQVCEAAEEAIEKVRGTARPASISP